MELSEYTSEQLRNELKVRSELKHKTLIENEKKKPYQLTMKLSAVVLILPFFLE